MKESLLEFERKFLNKCNYIVNCIVVNSRRKTSALALTKHANNNYFSKKNKFDKSLPFEIFSKGRILVGNFVTDSSYKAAHCS